MPENNFDIISCDVLIIGGGGAGIRAAIAAREKGADVLIVSKSRIGYGNNTFISKGVFAAATGWSTSFDNPEVHVKDIIEGGRFINDRRLVKKVAEGSPGQIVFLEKCGVKFSRKNGKIRMTHVPGHSYPRHVAGEHHTGSDFIIPLRDYASKTGVRFMEKVFITRLFTSMGRIAAATGIDHGGRFLSIAANCIVIATGGFAQVYLHNNNAAGMTGDGLALSFDLGLSLRDMEFIQFYPTALGKRGNRLLLYEALVFDAKAILRNSMGEDIVSKYGLSDPLKMTRDRLSRAIMKEILDGRDVSKGVMLDFSTVQEGDLRRMSHLLPPMKNGGKKELIISPTAHFTMGGVQINEETETAIQGLFAAGEVCSGVHGANRLGGNALAEVFAMGTIAGESAAKKALETQRVKFPKDETYAERNQIESLYSKGQTDIKELRRSLKETMWRNAGIIRHRNGIEEALKKIKELSSCIPDLYIKDRTALVKSLELRNMFLVSEMVCRAALKRTESRGAHYREEYSAEDNDNWLKNIVIRKEGPEMKLEA
jgi:succinate dehydrogenase/fumarate reductase flavoprotein subunit